MTKKPHAVSTGGAAYRRKNGLLPIQCDVTPEEMALVQAAADARGQSKSKFVKFAAVAEAKRVARESAAETVSE